MSVGKIIACTIIAGFVVLGNVETKTAITVEEYSGMWYNIGTISCPLNEHGELRCHRYNISNVEYNDVIFMGVHNFCLDEDFCRGRPGFGVVRESGISETIQYIRNGEFDSSIQRFNDGRELLQKSIGESKQYRLISRTPNASDEAKNALTEIARNLNVDVKWINHTHCGPFFNEGVHSTRNRIIPPNKYERDWQLEMEM